MKKVLIIGAGVSLAEYLIEALKGLDNVSLTLIVRSKRGIKLCLLNFTMP